MDNRIIAGSKHEQCKYIPAKETVCSVSTSIIFCCSQRHYLPVMKEA